VLKFSLEIVDFFKNIYIEPSLFGHGDVENAPFSIGGLTRGGTKGLGYLGEHINLVKVGLLGEVIKLGFEFHVLSLVPQEVRMVYNEWVCLDDIVEIF
jgi:hypothetical protein